MHNRFTKSAILLAIPAVLLLGLAGCGGSSSDGQTSGRTTGALAASTTTDLTGTWKLNRELSDPPPRRQWADSLRHGHHPYLDSLGGDHHWPPPDSMGGDHPWPPPDSLRHGFGRHHRPPMGDSLRPPMGDSLHMHGGFAMKITQTDSTVTMTGPFGREHTLYTDGRATTPQGPWGHDGATVSATWSAQSELVIVHTGPKGGTRTDTFSLTNNGSQLVITSSVKRPSDSETRSFRRVFDAVSSAR